MTTQRHMRKMLAQRWRERDPRGVWFWGSWLLVRWQILPILSFTISAVLAYLITGSLR